ncbi:MAG: histidine phosphatase family protein [Legionellales bacterium]|nr:histidine phosphatase family protein [Legionellales bacterium]
MLQKKYCKHFIFLSTIIFISLNCIATTQQISQELIYVRHGHRISYSQNKKIKEDYRKTARHKENPFDEPLTQKGKEEIKQTAIKLLEKIDINKYDYIYSSPMTRCLDTSEIISNEIYKITGKKLKIRVEYGLAESSKYYRLFIPTFSKEKLIINYPGDYYDGIIYDSVMDKKLYFENLIKKYKNIDKNYTSYTADRKIHKDANSVVGSLVGTIKRIVDENENILISGHGAGPYLHMHLYLTQEKYSPVEQIKLSMSSGGAKTTSFVSIFRKKLNQDWENIFPPKRLIESNISENLKINENF